MSGNSLAMSRPLGVAAAVGGGAIDVGLLLTRSVLLTGESAALATRNGQLCLLNCLRLLPRIAPSVTVSLPEVDAAFAAELRVLAQSAYRQGTLHLIEGEVATAEFDCVLNVGCGSGQSAFQTTINCNGWLVRATSDGSELRADMSQSNPISAMMAASLGVSEVFKRIYRIPESKAPRLTNISFSLFTYEPSQEPGPPLASPSLPETLVVGAGAIGNGLALLLEQLGVPGSIHFVDKQDFAEENLGTCVLLDDVRWLGASKAKSLAAWLGERTAVRATWDAREVSAATSDTYIRDHPPVLVLNGLDDVRARHDVQLLWPPVLVDGGINAAGAAVVTSRLDRPENACLRCAFTLPTEDATLLQQSASGLARETLEDLSQILTDRDVELAHPERRAWLREMKAQGKTRCATVGDAVSAQLGI